MEDYFCFFYLSSFQFTVMGKDNFEKELDIFANFFIEALIEKSAVDRQLAAIDSEFDLRKVSGLILILKIFLKIYIILNSKPLTRKKKFWRATTRYEKFFLKKIILAPASTLETD